MSNINLMEMSAGDLREYREACKREVDDAKASLAEVDAAIKLRFAGVVETVDGLYAKLGKLSGIARTTEKDGTRVKFDRKKKVVWSQEKLKLHLSADYSMFRDLIKVTFSVDEKAYNALPDALPAKGSLRDARTVTYSTAVDLEPPKS